jgi:hypothetical protein
MRSTITFRLEPNLSAALDLAARAADRSISGYIRDTLTKALPDSANLPSTRPSPPRRPIVIPDPGSADLVRLAGEIGRATGATIQLAKALREAGRIPEHAATEAVLRDLRAGQVEFVRLMSERRKLINASCART